MELIINNAPWQRAAALYVRMCVFVLERGISLADEFDDADIDGTVYAVIYDQALPIATGRLLKEDDTLCRFTRIATLKEYRGQQRGAKIIHALEQYAISQNFKKAQIHSELTAKVFYEKQGYIAVSEVYDEDGVPCQTLEKVFS
ncbi:GNAT family N-acetyltransferase [Vagococcus hydrophili]|uniref:GNAT family N-acetyltransferase n=2 Tax=Vagococcus hydrophili TaxID=2714947 RepID=A0A6G8ASF8_9ENTE|nr:GNAT family N-acetyltransferase [Vagococcus hydrophili]QIL47872.1 GNAT family N-acetyltransferase [Vagococcus hydrophili]